MDRTIPAVLFAFAAWASLWWGASPLQPNDVGGAGQIISKTASPKK